MFTDSERRMWGLTDDRVATVRYCLKRTSDEMGFPVDLNFIRKQSSRAAIMEVKAHFTLGLKIVGGEAWTKADIMRVLGNAHCSSVSANILRARRTWSTRYWKGYKIRAQSDRAMRAAA